MTKREPACRLIENGNSIPWKPYNTGILLHYLCYRFPRDSVHNTLIITNSSYIYVILTYNYVRLFATRIDLRTLVLRSASSSYPLSNLGSVRLMSADSVD